MKERMELNEQALEDVVGGKISFYEDDDKQWKCKVADLNAGTTTIYNTTQSGAFQYMMMRNANPGLTEHEYEKKAVEAQIIWAANP